MFNTFSDRYFIFTIQMKCIRYDIVIPDIFFKENVQYILVIENAILYKCNSLFTARLNNKSKHTWNEKFDK